MSGMSNITWISMEDIGSPHAQVTHEDVATEDGISNQASPFLTQIDFTRNELSNPGTTIMNQDNGSISAFTRSWQLSLSLLYRHIIPILAVGGLMATLSILLIHSQIRNVGTVCGIDGSFRLDSTTRDYNLWQTNIFDINLALGHMEFRVAKFIDVIWDVAIGRGGQALLAYISYIVFSQALTHKMTSHSVSYNTFEAVTLQSNSVWFIVKVLKDLKTNGDWHARATVLWMAFSATMVLTFPTLASAMTGYSANFNAMVQVTRDMRIPTRKFSNVMYIIHDGARLGEPFYNDYPVIDLHDGELSILDFSSVLQNYTDFRGGNHTRYLDLCSNSSPGKFDVSNGSIQAVDVDWKRAPMSPSECRLLWRVSEYTYNYGFLGFNQTNSTFYDETDTGISLSSPTLNISAYFSFADTKAVHPVDFKESYQSAWAVHPFGITWKPNDTTPRYPFDTSNPHLADTDRTIRTILDQKDFNRLGICNDGSKTGLTYNWGFSFFLLFICVILLLVWIIGTYVLALNTYLNEQPASERRSMGMKRAVIDLSLEYQKNIKNKDVSAYSEERLSKLVGNGQMTFQNMEPSSLKHDSTRAELLSKIINSWLDETQHQLFFIVILVSTGVGLGLGLGVVI